MAQTFPDYTGRVYVTRERLNSGGYTPQGVYFGIGLPLYFVQDYDGDCLPFGEYIRAADRDHAVDIAGRMFPAAKIYGRK